MNATTLDEVMAKLASVQVSAPPASSLKFSADEQVVAAHSSGLTRASQALAAASASSTHYVEFEHDAVRFFAGTARISAERTDFVLVLLGYGLAEDTREIVGAIRLYPRDASEAYALLDNPSLALATVIGRYGESYQVEGGERSIFEPLVEFERGRFVLPGRIEQAELLEALDLPTAIEVGYMMITSLRVMPSGEVKLFFPILLRSDWYEADVRAARGR